MLEIAGGIILAFLFIILLPYMLSIVGTIIILVIGLAIIGILILLFYSYPEALWLLLVPLIIVLINYMDDSDKIIKEIQERKRRGHNDNV